ncbi:MAG: hypothetical protein Q9225_001553 [Loekoesia sp. 1 TL-2023]
MSATGSGYGALEPQAPEEVQTAPIIEKRRHNSTILSNAVVLVIDEEYEKDSIILDGASSKSWRIRLCQVVDDFDHYYSLDFRFDVNPDMNPNNEAKWQHLYIHIPSSSLRSEDANVKFDHVQCIKQVPEALQKNTRIMKMAEDNKLQVIRISYDSLFVMKERAFEVQPSEKATLDCVRQINAEKSGQMLLFMHAGKSTKIEKFRNDICNSTVEESDPMWPYCWPKNNPRVEWQSEKSLEDVPNFAYDPPTVFHTLEQWYVTYAYGTIRDARYEIDQVKAIRAERRKIQIFEIPPLSKHKSADGKLRASNRTYCAFAELTEQEAGMKNFDIGEKFEVWFFDPDTQDEEMQQYKELPQWQAEVIPQLSSIATPGNLTFLLTRPPGDNAFDDITTNKEISEFHMKSHTVYFVPEDSEKAAKRMVNAINNVWDGKSAKHVDLRRILQGLTPKESHKFGFFDNLTPEENRHLSALYKQLRPDQQAAFDQLCKTDMMAFILGPPGSGKSFFVSVLAQMMAAVGKPLIIACPSNAAVDVLAQKIYDADPNLPTIRFHGLSFESSTMESEIRKFQAKARPKSETKATTNQPSTDPDAEDDDEDNTAQQQILEDYANLRPYTMESGKTAGKKSERLNFPTMSLMRRCLEYVGLPHGQPLVNNDTTRKFREVYTAGPSADYGETGYRKTFKDAMEAVQIEVFSRASIVLTTMSNSNDRLLRTSFFPRCLIWDEVASSTEAETLMPWTAFLKSLEFVVGVGDPRQLRPICKSYRAKNADGDILNPFGEAQRQSLMERRARLGDQFIRLEISSRMTAGLEQPSAGKWYGGNLRPDDSCALTMRPKSQQFLQYMREEFQREIQIPRLVLNVAQGVSKRKSNGSRYNLHNIAVAFREIHKLLSRGLFTADEIRIGTPYRAQASLYRGAIAGASRREDWKGLDPLKMRVMTIDSLQGREGGLVVLDMVVGAIREGGLGFMGDPHRLNVALTRPIHAIMVIADLDVTKKPKPRKGAEEAVIPEEEDDDSEDKTMKQPDQGWSLLKEIYNFFMAEGSVYHVDKSSLPQDLVQFGELE